MMCGNVMGLKIDYVTDYGITCNDAICVMANTMTSKETIINADGSLTKVFKINYNGKIYASQAAYEANAAPIGGFGNGFDLDASAGKTQYNIIKQCYLNLKTITGFTDGVDC
jgi:hypothetical protein